MIANPWVLLGLLLGFLVVGASGYAVGKSHGVTAQKVEDQRAIDSINKQLSDQKTEAAAILKRSNDDLQAARDERDGIKDQMEKQHVKDQSVTNALRDKYAGLSLRFVTKTPGCGSSGADTVPQAGGAASNTSTAVVQLPDTLARDLRQSAAACDSLKDDYKLLYDWAHAQ